MKIELRELSLKEIEEIKTLFVEIFTKEPWNDDWSDEKQLHYYIRDLIGNPNSLSFGFYCDGKMSGLALGNIKHWHEGTEYCIDEFCIQTSQQGLGMGSRFMKEIEHFLAKRGIGTIFLLTGKDVPAYHFYQKNGFVDLKNSVAFVKNFSE